MPKANVLTRAKKNKAEVLFREGKLEGAKIVFEEVCRLDKIDAEAWIMLAVLNRKLKDFIAAEACSRRALELRPRDARAHSALGAALQCRGDLASAISHYYKAIALDASIADAHYLLGNALRETGRFADAANAYLKATQLRPAFVEALSNLGATLTLLGDSQGAAKALNAALEAAPNTPQILCNLGNLAQQTGRFSLALEYYERVLALDPMSVDALGGAATLLEKAHRLDEAREFVARGLSTAPNHCTLNLVAAKLARRDRRTREAIETLENILRQSPSPEIGGEANALLGQLYDREGDAQRAFGHIVEGNQIVARAAGQASDPRRYLQRILDNSNLLTNDLVSRCVNKLPENDAAPIFLLGFPRSGTTLLEQILDSHPGLQALDEKPAIQLMAERFSVITQGRGDPLASLSDAEIAELRGIYFEEVARHLVCEPGSMLIDKMPFNTMYSPLIWRIFPQAKFILAIRHPCDVCLSCLMQDFAINEAMASFFTLEDTVRAYVEVMSLWRRCAELLPLNYHRVRYEDLVADFQGEARSLLKFLEVGWNDAVLEYSEHAKKRGTINTPSYHQVTQPIYQHAKYRWKRYASQFEPHMEALAPFIEYFGYADDEHRNQPAPMDLSV